MRYRCDTTTEQNQASPLLKGALALLVLLASGSSLAEDGRVSLQSGSLADNMLRHPWLAQMQSLWPASQPAERRPERFAPLGRGWQFSFELQDAVPYDTTRQQSPAYRLPMLGGESSTGKLLSGGVRKAFGEWTLRLNVKQQDSMEYGSFRKPALSASWQPEHSGVLAGINLSRTSRTPGFWSTGNPYANSGPGSSEKSRQAEIFVANAGNSPWRARLSLFQAYYRDMMDFDGGPPPSLVNRARVYMRGVEASLARRWTNGAQAYLHLASMASYDSDSGIDLRYRPHEQATSGFSVPLAGPLHLHASLTWYGRRIDAIDGTASAGSYAETGMMLSWKTAGNQAFFAIDNLTDRRANDLLPGWANGRRLRLGWQGRF